MLLRTSPPCSSVKGKSANKMFKQIQIRFLSFCLQTGLGNSGSLGGWALQESLGLGALGSLWVGHSRQSLALGNAGSVWGWALQRVSWVGHFRFGHCRSLSNGHPRSLSKFLRFGTGQALGLGTPGRLWALQGVSGKEDLSGTPGSLYSRETLRLGLGLGVSELGQSRRTLGLGTPGLSGLGTESLGLGTPGRAGHSRRGEELSLKSNSPTPKVGNKGTPLGWLLYKGTQNQKTKGKGYHRNTKLHVLLALP